MQFLKSKLFPEYNDIGFQHSVDLGKRRFFVSVCSG